ncbi:MAG: hypothetical protein CL910_09205 [Deltaproteobacteria bacterium]|nr:hypothetical protein [Deltaproteobacteria bacterium]
MIEALRSLFLASTWRMAWRNVGRNPRRTGIIGSAISIGVGATIFAMAINFGMIFGMVRAAIDTELGHVQVHGIGFEKKPGLEISLDPSRIEEARIEELPGLTGWARRVRHEGLVSSPRAAVGVRVVGVEPGREASVTQIATSIVEGSFLGSERRRVVMGARLARRLKVKPGDKVVVSAQDLAGDLTGEAFRVAGLFETSSRELDESAVYLALDEAQEMLGLGEAISELVLRTTEGADPEALALQLSERLGDGAEVRTWEEMRPTLVAMVAMFDQIGWVLYAAVFVAMAFGIANVLMMSLYERIREVGIMMAIGMRPGRMVAAMLAESILLTTVGVGLGLLIGLGGAELLSEGIDFSRWSDGLTGYGIPTKIIPSVRTGDLRDPVVIAVITAILASLWPALRAARIQPADAIRHV